MTPGASPVSATIAGSVALPTPEQGRTFPPNHAKSAMTPDPFSYLQPFTVWENAFSPAELDAIVALGDHLKLEKASVTYTDGAAATNDPVRITRTAWMARNSETAWIYERL